MGALRVALVNDYEIVVQGFAAMLRCYRDRIEILELDATGPVAHPVDIALYDTFAGDPDGHEVLRRMSTNPLIRSVVVYSWNLDPALVRTAMASGARGYLSKALPADGLVRALEVLARGETASPQGPRWHVQPVGGDWPGREEGLTQREAEVLALITQGLSNDEIAHRTRLSINSIKSYIRSAYRRIGVSDRSNAILWGVDHGFRPDRARRHE